MTDATQNDPADKAPAEGEREMTGDGADTHQKTTSQGAGPHEDPAAKDQPAEGGREEGSEGA